MRSVVWSVIGIATLALLASTVVSFAGPLHWWLDLFAQFRPQYLLGLLVLLPVFLFGRRWKACLLVLAGIAANASVLLPHAQQSIVQQSVLGIGPRVRCLTLNVLQRNHDFAGIERFLRSENADVVVLQEVSPELAEYLKGLADLYPHQHPRGRKDSKGAALLTKHPVRRIGFDEMPEHAPIGATCAEIDGPVPFTIFGIHSHKPTAADGAATQHAYFAWLLQKCATANAEGRPVVLMGDFNSTPWSQAFRAFTNQTHVHDTSRGVIFGATWSFALPYRLLIDHAFVTPEWRVLSRRIGPDVGSDHRALIVDLAIPQ